MKAPEIVVFHYHLRPGGVTSVILHSVRAIAAEMPEIERIRIVAGEEPDGKLREALVAAGRPKGRPVIEIDVASELGYAASDRAAFPDVDRIERLLLDRWGGRLWWVHNYHIGKNPALTQALLAVASSRPEQPMLLHIHDLPEAGRFENMRDLEGTVSLPLYPLLPNVRYAVINDHDRRLLIDAGLPSEVVHLLHNPVEAGGIPAVRASEIRKRLADSFGALFPAFRADSPQLFYPVRAIRRKNVHEAALLAKLSPDHPNLIVTLPGVSARERGYSSSLEAAFKSGRIKGMFGIGESLSQAGIDFPSLAAATDRVVSTSVQEGFGYLFADSLRWGKPLVARNLATLGGIADLLRPDAARLYDRLLVPLEVGERSRLAAAYDRHIDRIASSLLAPQAARDRIHELLRDEAVDYSYLSVEIQSELIDAAESSAFCSEVRRMNRALFDGIEGLAPPASSAATSLTKHFGYSAHVDALRAIIASFDLVLPDVEVGAEVVQQRLRTSLETPEYLRLLLASG